MIERRSVNPWYYIFGGCMIGVAIGVLAAPLAGYELPKSIGEGDTKEPGIGSKILAKIPTKVKVAGVVGGVKGAGSEAYREIKDRVRRKA